MDRLIVKNFGPLKDVDIELNKINIFIGENGSGKSILGKIITLLLDFREKDEKKLLQNFSDYSIAFFSKKTFIQLYITGELLVEIKHQTIFLHDDLKSKIDVKKVTKIEQNIHRSSELSKEIKTQLLDFLNELFLGCVIQSGNLKNGLITLNKLSLTPVTCWNCLTELIYFPCFL